MNSATCVAKYEDDDYQCACTPGYVGKHCEIGILKGLGHAILGNFSTDQIGIELTKI